MDFDQIPVPQFDGPPAMGGDDAPMGFDPLDVADHPDDLGGVEMLDDAGEEAVEAEGHDEIVDEAPQPVVDEEPADDAVDLPVDDELGERYQTLIEQAREMGAPQEILDAIAGADDDLLDSIGEALDYDPVARSTFFAAVLEVPTEIALFGHEAAPVDAEGDVPVAPAAPAVPTAPAAPMAPAVPAGPTAPIELTDPVPAAAPVAQTPTPAAAPELVDQPATEVVLPVDDEVPFRSDGVSPDAAATGTSFLATGGPSSPPSIDASPSGDALSPADEMPPAPPAMPDTMPEAAPVFDGPDGPSMDTPPSELDLPALDLLPPDVDGLDTGIDIEEATSGDEAGSDAADRAIQVAGGVAAATGAAGAAGLSLARRRRAQQTPGS